MVLKPNKLHDVPAYQLCCGCGICAYLYPEHIFMRDVPSLGRRPIFKERAAESEAFFQALEICPGTSLTHMPEVLQQEGLIASLAKAWGPVFEIWEGHAADPEIRLKGSSGGAISAISLYCIEREGKYGVLHTTTDDEKPYLNKTTLSRNRDSILTAAGSRYSPASPCEKLQEIQTAPSPCVFVGKPCDVAAVNNARQYIPALDGNVELTIACFCAGTPSTNGTLEMLRKMGCDSPDGLIALRYRGCGWPGKATAIDNNNVSLELTYQQSWGDILQKYRQWRCYICPDHSGEFADISIGDPWYRKIGENEKGRSLIIVRSEKGKEIIGRALNAGYLTAEEVDPGVLPASQPNLIKTRAMLWGRLLALKLNGVPCPTYSGFNLASSWKDDLTLKEKIQSIVGTTRRIYTKKLAVALSNTQ
jgi:coenzyme F420 hydrogenase subunit beta